MLVMNPLPSNREDCPGWSCCEDTRSPSDVVVPSRWSVGSGMTETSSLNVAIDTAAVVLSCTVPHSSTCQVSAVGPGVAVKLWTTARRTPVGHGGVVWGGDVTAVAVIGGDVAAALVIGACVTVGWGIVVISAGIVVVVVVEAWIVVTAVDDVVAPTFATCCNAVAWPPEPQPRPAPLDSTRPRVPTTRARFRTRPASLRSWHASTLRPVTCGDNFLKRLLTLATASGILRPMAKLAAYVRVSTDRQAEEGLGLDVQRHAIRGWAKEHGHRIALWTSDEGVSGSNGLDTRQGLLTALGALQDGSVSGLVVYRLDRLARDLVLQESLLAEIWRAGSRLYSTSAAEDAYLDPQGADADPSRALIRQILGAVASYERAMIRLRLRSGKQRKEAAGGYIGGAPPLGFRAESGSLVPDENETRIRQRVLALRAHGESLRQICEVLSAEGLQPKRGGRWHPETVRKIAGKLA